MQPPVCEKKKDKTVERESVARRRRGKKGTGFQRRRWVGDQGKQREKGGRGRTEIEKMKRGAETDAQGWEGKKNLKKG